MAPSFRNPSFHQRARRPLAYAALFAAALLLALAAAYYHDLKRGSVHSPEVYKILCEEAFGPFFSETAPGSGRYRAVRRMALAEEFSMPKPAGVRRVFILGESVAEILGSGRQYFPPGEGVELINCGMGGYDSVRILAALREVLNYSPDLVVILSGNNESMTEIACPGLADGFRRRRRRLLEKRLGALKASLSLHRENLEKMAAAAEKAGVPAVFCTLPANMADMPPRAPLQLGDPQFALAYRYYHEGNYARALELLEKGLSNREEGADLQLYAARALEKLGRREEAAGRCLQMKDEETGILKRNAMIRELGRGRGRCVADLDLYFSRQAGGLPGFEQFTDGVHWRGRYNAPVVGEILRAAVACGPKLPPPAPVPAPAEEAEALASLNYAVNWMDGGYPGEAALAQLAWLRKKAPALLEKAAASPAGLPRLVIVNSRSFGGVLDPGQVYPRLLAHLAELERRSGARKEALSLIDRALSFEPGDRSFRLVRAQVLHGLGRTAAAEKEFLDLASAPDARGEALGLAAAYGAIAPERAARKGEPGEAR